jgi:hypothetical protein
LQVQNGLTFGVVLGRDDLLGFVFIGRMKAARFAGGFVHGIIHPATAVSAN